jgi:hypothetical protein
LGGGALAGLAGSLDVVGRVGVVGVRRDAVMGHDRMLARIAGKRRYDGPSSSSAVEPASVRRHRSPEPT